MPSPQPSRQEILRHRAVEAFPGSFSGSEGATWLIVSAHPLDATTRHALYASAQALGADPSNLAYLVVGRNEREDENEHECDNKNKRANNDQREAKQTDATQTAAIPVDTTQANAAQLISLIEALDPLAVVLADHASVALASRAYHKPLTLESSEHLLGRPCCCFENLEALMERPSDKQRAWSCLKTLGI